jgi:hypothetical protein
MLVPSTSSFVVKNVSGKTLDVAGLRLKPGKTADLFKSIKWLTESKVFDLMSMPNGALYRKIFVLRELSFKSSNFFVINTATQTAQSELGIDEIKESVVDVGVVAQTSMNVSQSGVSSANRKIGQSRGMANQDLSAAKTELRNSVDAEAVERKREVMKIRSELGSIVATINSFRTQEKQSTMGAFDFDILGKIDQIHMTLSGDLAMSIVDGYEEEIDATILNSAEPGALVKEFSVMMSCMCDNSFPIAGFNIAPVIAKNVVFDSIGVGDPVLSRQDGLADPISFSNGVVGIRVTFDTDAGVTKTYIPGDLVSITVSVSVDDKYLGFIIPSVTKTYIVV